MADQPCPCGNPSFAHCCAPYLDASALPSTAEATMRSRYSAFVTGNIAHLLRTWHPKTRPTGPIDTGGGWTGLDVLDVVAGGPDDQTGVVEFIAHNHDGDLHERSRFERRGGRWMYLDGEFS